MAHLVVECSELVARDVSLEALCASLHCAMLECGIFPIEGIRVRAYVPQAAEIADRDPGNGFVAMTLSVGHGRSKTDLAGAGDIVFAAAQAFLAEWRQGGHFALSLEIREIDSDLTWKDNTIRGRLHAASHQGT